MKKNITPGPWATNAEECFVYGDKNRLYGTMKDLVCDPPYSDEDYNNWKANASAIVTAVNNTYHKGINPEAVEELLQVAKALWKQNILDPEAQENLNRIIQKATL